MLASLALAGLTLRSGLEIRSARLRRLRRAPDLRPRHLRRAKLVIPLLVIGAAGGPISMVLLRGQPPFATAHAFVGLLAIAAFLGTAWLGRRLRAHDHGVRDRHAILALVAALLSAAAFGTGFVLLP